jgi:hypothetical protein
MGAEKTVCVATGTQCPGISEIELRKVERMSGSAIVFQMLQRNRKPVRLRQFIFLCVGVSPILVMKMIWKIQTSYCQSVQIRIVVAVSVLVRAVKIPPF